MGESPMKQISIDDHTYERLESEAARLHLSVDTYLSTVLMRQAAQERAIPKSISGIGLFADIPDVMDAIVADAMAARSKPWRLSDEESSS
jgi:hypothetical protein